MTRRRAEQLGSLFLAVFSTGLAAQLALDGMTLSQWVGATVAVTGSVVLAWSVRAWPQPVRG